MHKIFHVTVLAQYGYPWSHTPQKHEHFLREVDFRICSKMRSISSFILLEFPEKLSLITTRVFLVTNPRRN